MGQAGKPQSGGSQKVSCPVSFVSAYPAVMPDLQLCFPLFVEII
jgi:hypothetical protein